MGFAFQEGARLPGRPGGKMLRAEQPPEQLASSVTPASELPATQLFPPQWSLAGLFGCVSFHFMPSLSLPGVLFAETA